MWIRGQCAFAQMKSCGFDLCNFRANLARAAVREGGFKVGLE